MFNLSLKTGVFPDIFKIAKVTPMLKKRFLSFINKYAPPTVQQHGFRKSKSTQTPIFEFLDCILKSLDQHKLAEGIFRDLSKAFDILDHNILLEKLERRGGSILGPLLFLIFVDGLVEYTSPTKTILFADDTSILLTGSNPETLQSTAESSMERLSEWFTKKQTHYKY
ncbi:uncharacterized protein LOC124787778 [Schistocerca piceifrons]|uniref:uncharacterized protein LOC124787778 n=1 Tax=Schistocerca piceifrons TaxID=274613 RepID=UPI001F5EC893|nr:uncharacterized protein LOC124787778 [Schistocerca piceifrons]